MQYTLYVGIDIAARSMSAAWGEDVDKIQAKGQVQQTPQGWRQLIDKLQAGEHPPETTLVVIEATSTYWMRPAMALHQAGFQVSVINPKQAHHFAKAVLQQAKTDPLDAVLLARLGAALQPQAWQPPTDLWEEMYQRLAERDSLVEMRQMMRNQRHARQHRAYTVDPIEDRQRNLLDHLENCIGEIDQELANLLQMDDQWQQAADYLRSIPGIGPLSAAWLLVVTHVFTTCDHAAQLVSYLGLAPHPIQSGTTRHGHRLIGGGHARARRVLYQAGVTAARYNPTIKAFYDRLIANGKPVKVARCAVTRKLVHIAFAVATKEQMFDPNYQQQHLELSLAA